MSFFLARISVLKCDVIEMRILICRFVEGTVNLFIRLPSFSRTVKTLSLYPGCCVFHSLAHLQRVSNVPSLYSIKTKRRESLRSSSSKQLHRSRANLIELLLLITVTDISAGPFVKAAKKSSNARESLQRDQENN